MIVELFGLFQVQVEGMPGQPFELREPHLGHALEALDAVDVDAATRERILRMVDAKVPVR